MLHAKTQKAIGVLEGIPKLLHKYSLGEYLIKPNHCLFKTLNDIEKYSKTDYGKTHNIFHGFARPCPIRPRHGFVESKVINSKDELLALMKEVKEQDKSGEIILGPYFDKINCSAVYVSSGMLSVGPGNDGATGGKNSISFPVAPFVMSADFLKSVKIKKSGAVYLETICDKNGYNFLTQIRGGPRIRVESEDFIPCTLAVKKVISPNKDLLAWEKEVKTIKNGTVVYGNGYTLASHAAVHCVLHNIPFIVSHKPKVGEIIKATEEKELKRPLNRRNFRKGVDFVLKNNLFKSMSLEFKFCLSILHNWAYLRKSVHADWLFGVLVTLFVKLCTALVFGEHRHFGTRHFNSRTDAYNKVRNKCLNYANKLPGIFKDFYSRTWTSGFGGIPWANCALFAGLTWKLVVDMFNRKRDNISDEEIAKVIDIINKTINLAHNNGWWFNKIAMKEDMDFAADNPGLLSLCVSDGFFNAAKNIKSVKKIAVKLKPMKDIVAPCGINNNNKLVWAYLVPENCRHRTDGLIDIPLYMWEENKDVAKKSYVSLSNDIVKHIKKLMTTNGKLFLNVIQDKGFAGPDGKTIEYVGIQAVKL